MTTRAIERKAVLKQRNNNTGYDKPEDGLLIMNTQELLQCGGSDDGYLTKPEVARRLRRSTRTVEIWMRRGFVPYMKLGRAILFDWPTIQRHLAENHLVITRPRIGLARRRC